MKHPLLEAVEKDYKRADLPDFRAGDSLRVHYRITEAGRDRIQVFEGLCLARHGNGGGSTFTVRRIAHGVGVERIFPLHSPRIANLEVVRRGRVRRARLYYLRGLVGKHARIKEKRDQ